MWCPGRDLNSHDLAATTPSRWRVCQFHHLGIEWSRLPESNWRPARYECAALPSKLNRRVRHRVIQISVEPLRVRHWCPVQIFNTDVAFAVRANPCCTPYQLRSLKVAVVGAAPNITVERRLGGGFAVFAIVHFSALAHFCIVELRGRIELPTAPIPRVCATNCAIEA